MRKLKIGIIGTRGIPNHYGGFEQFAEHLSAGLVQRGHEVAVYNSSLHPYTKNEWNGVEIIHCRDWEHKIGTAGQFFYDLNCIRDSRTRNFDVLLHLGYTSDSVWHHRWPKQSVNIVNMDGLEWQRSKYNKLTQRFLKWAEALAAKNAHTMIADSHGIQDYLFKKYGTKPVYVPYGAKPFTQPESSVLKKYDLVPHCYFLLIARMEPENNIEMIIKGHLAAASNSPLFVIGNITNKFGKHITSKYKHSSIRFCDAIYDQHELDNLRYYSSLYFHGHSAGGTNPSLLEAMACGCRIAAHDNPFNRAVLQSEADYFEDAHAVAVAINTPKANWVVEDWKRLNLEKIRLYYDHEKIIDRYEEVMLIACGEEKIVMQPAVAEAV